MCPETFKQFVSQPLARVSNRNKKVIQWYFLMYVLKIHIALFSLQIEFTGWCIIINCSVKTQSCSFDRLYGSNIFNLRNKLDVTTTQKNSGRENMRTFPPLQHWSGVLLGLCFLFPSIHFHLFCLASAAPFICITLLSHLHSIRLIWICLRPL